MPATDTDITSAQHFWTGGLETAGPRCYDAVAIALGRRFPDAGYEPHPSAIERYTSEVKRLARVLNHRLEEVPWLAGDEYSMADIITFPWIHRRADGRAFCRARQHRSRRLPGRQTLVRRDDGTSGGPARPRGAGRATARSVDQ